MSYIPVDGPQCGQCLTSEAHCAGSYPCCKDCTHFGAVITELHAPEPGDYNEFGEKFFLCNECGVGMWRKPQGPASRMCEDCLKTTLTPAGNPRTRHVQRRLSSEEFEHYDWLVNYRGVAHLFHRGARMSHCGATRARGTDPGQYMAEFAQCKRCLGYVPLGEVDALPQRRDSGTETRSGCDDYRESTG